MSSCSLCKQAANSSREEIVYTLHREGFSTMTDGSVTLSDIKEHKFQLCRACQSRQTRLKLIVVATMLLFVGVGLTVMLMLTPDDDAWFLGLAALVGGFAFGLMFARFFSDAAKLKKLAVAERNIPGYTAMTKGEYDAFAKAAKWDRGEFD